MSCHANSSSAIRPKRNGFTLLELLVTLALLGVLAALAAPSFTDTIHRYRVSTVANEFAASINLARDSAIQRNGNVTIAKLAGSACTDSGDWSCGWQIFRDVNGNGTLNAGTDELIQEFRISAGVSVMRPAGGDSMTGNRWGQLNGNGTAGFTLSPKDVGVSSSSTTTVCINSGGRVRVTLGNVTC